ncbi:subtilisin-like protein [Tothia fuscella]|uniref:Subtilisin-like protein n=1 Tax=Tothia fuscella TaxID=1048955 RepID=A0A9P4NPJ6_9PEZI|nr:subtilisin-like protein [Tothia fuscella]
MRLFFFIQLLLVGIAYAQEKTPYIVVFQPNTPLGLIDGLLKTVLGLLDSLTQFTSGPSFSGIAARLTPSQADSLRQNPSVKYIEKDGVFTTLGSLSLKRHSKRTMLNQSPGIWGLGRVSHRAKGVNNYVFDDSAGSGTCIYVVDSGINTGHQEFEGRASFLYNWVYESTDDLSGHGTAVAGTIAARTFGVAKKANLYSLKACDRNGNCDVSKVISAIAYATSDYRTKVNNGQCKNGGFINLSLGGISAGWQSVKDSVVAATQAGILVVAAAGNDHANTQNYLPASAPGACAVGATDSNDGFASFSNWGATVAVLAPGVYVQSTFIGSNTATAYFDGTSMAAPHVVGLGAYLNAKNGKQSPVALCNYIKSTSTQNTVTGLGGLTGTPNKIAYNGAA